MGSNLLTMRTGSAIKEDVGQNQGIMGVPSSVDTEAMQQE
jgi:hypothetical protein